MQKKYQFQGQSLTVKLYILGDQRILVNLPVIPAMRNLSSSFAYLLFLDGFCLSHLVSSICSTVVSSVYQSCFSVESFWWAVWHLSVPILIPPKYLGGEKNSCEIGFQRDILPLTQLCTVALYLHLVKVIHLNRH